MSNKRKAEVLVDSDEVECGGTLSEKHTVSCRFGRFATLAHKRGDATYSRVLKCHGLEWKIILYPGGDKQSDAEKVHVTVRLALTSKITDVLRVKYFIRAGTRNEGSVSAFQKKVNSWGYSDFALRADVLNPSNGYLDDEGALVVKVDIQVYMKERPIFTPKKKLQLDMLKLFESARDADVTFTVDGTKFPAHSLILVSRAPTLASMVEDADGTEVSLSNVDPHVFRQLLRCVYGDELPSLSDKKRDARALLQASDRFGCTDMKLHVESEVVRSVLAVDNAADWILFADSHSCALLKESAISLFTANSKAVMKSPGWTAVTESADIMKELMQATFLRDSETNNETDAKKMSVTSLRRELEEKGLDVDGTREMLVERLEKANST